jgi:cell division protein FtsW (lipid II flippase)
MNDAQIHLALNHFPILGTLFGTVLLGIGVFGKNKSLLDTGLIILFLMALITIPVYLSGEGAEEIVEELGVDHDIIHEHEEIAESAVWFMDGLGLLALVSFFFTRRTLNRPARILTIVTFVMGIVVLGLMFRVGGSGGEIRHTEIREAVQ